MDATEGGNSFVTDPIAAFVAAESKLTRALSAVWDHAHGHMLLGLVQILTNRAVEGIAECEHALELDRNLANAHAIIGLGKIFIGCAGATEAHVAEALRLSPRDMLANNWITYVGVAQNLLGGYEQAVVWCRRAIEANRNFPLSYFQSAAALAHLGRLDEALSAVKAGLALDPAFTIARARASWTAMSDDRTFLTQLEPSFEAMRKAGVPER